MRKNWTEKDIKQLHRDKRIRSFDIPEKTIHSGNRIPKQEKRSKEKDWIRLNLQYWCNQRALTLLEEHLFDEPSVQHGHPVPARKWKFDFAITAYKIAIEYEGIMSEQSRHTHVRGYTGDVQKYNRAQELGWRVLRFTAINYLDLLKTLNGCI